MMKFFDKLRGGIHIGFHPYAFFCHVNPTWIHSAVSVGCKAFFNRSVPNS